MNMNHRIFAVGIALSLAATVAIAQGGAKLFINGKLVSSKIKVIDGVPYVPVADVAKGQELQLVKRPDGYSLMPAGGANQLAGKYEGKIGQRLFTGQYGLTVTKVENLPIYKGKYRNLYGDVEADDQNAVIVVSCTIHNGVKTTQNLVVDDWKWEPKGFQTNTSLANTNGQSFPVHKWDVRWTETAPGGVKLLPGASSDFNLVFKVPKDTVAKDLIFSFLPYDKRTDSKPLDVRISLQ